ncbi:MAG: hypothetical protein Q7I99_07900 [Acholeplasmataceae bacterium]|nr:hypothetical protein [Acholeplasmataceae bacterium]
MLCEICRKKVKTSKNILNLFSPEIHHICEMCYQKYPLLMRSDVLPVEGGVATHQLMSARYYSIKPIAFMSFLKPYYIDFLKHHQSKTLLVFDILDEQTLEIMDSLKLGDLYVVTLYENI